MDWRFTDDRPIWLQLTEQLTRRIITGVYPPGSRLPPVRELAAQAGVNPNTMQRALAQLEQDGLAFADRTAGRLVTEDTSVLTPSGGPRPGFSSNTTMTLWPNWATPGPRPQSF